MLFSSSQISFIQIKISSFDSIYQGKIKNNANSQIDSSKKLETREILEIINKEIRIIRMTKKIIRFRSKIQNHRLTMSRKIQKNLITIQTISIVAQSSLFQDIFAVYLHEHFLRESIINKNVDFFWKKEASVMNYSRTRSYHASTIYLCYVLALFVWYKHFFYVCIL